MAQEYDNNMRGVLFNNERKESDRHPDYKGNCEIEGVEYWVDGWIKNGRKGEFISLSFKEKGSKGAPAAKTTIRRSEPARREEPQEKRQSFDDMDDDIPF